MPAPATVMAGWDMSPPSRVSRQKPVGRPSAFSVPFAAARASTPLCVREALTPHSRMSCPKPSAIPHHGSPSSTGVPGMGRDARPVHGAYWASLSRSWARSSYPVRSSPSHGSPGTRARMRPSWTGRTEPCWPTPTHTTGGSYPTRPRRPARPPTRSPAWTRPHGGRTRTTWASWAREARWRESASPASA